MAPADKMAANCSHVAKVASEFNHVMAVLPGPRRRERNANAIMVITDL